MLVFGSDFVSLLPPARIPILIPLYTYQCTYVKNIGDAPRKIKSRHYALVLRESSSNRKFGVGYKVQFFSSELDREVAEFRGFFGSVVTTMRCEKDDVVVVTKTKKGIIVACLATVCIALLLLQGLCCICFRAVHRAITFAITNLSENGK